MDITGRDCRDVDECLERLGICNNGACTNIAGSFQCNCLPGFSLTTNKEQCVDIDECSRSPGLCGNGTCINSLGSYMCRCNAGFQVGFTGDCQDIDECRSMFALCRNGRCRNTVGGVTCDCPTGYGLTPDGLNCRDTDECRDPSLCLPPGVCQNMMGSYLCKCPPGFELDSTGTKCIDINECLVDLNLCSKGFCHNTEGGFECECSEGWVLSSDGSDCEDRREASCYMEYRSGYCLAPHGSNMTRQSCCCTLGQAWGDPCQPCPPDTHQEFALLCPHGRGRGGGLQDINECDMMEDLCRGGHCINTDGSFRCTCPTGYRLDSSGRNCQDLNECDAFNFCGNGTCTNLRGGFQCECSQGYAPGRDGRLGSSAQILLLYISHLPGTCQDVNECLEQDNKCAFRCHNTVGSYRCVCPYGYQLAVDGRHCKGKSSFF